MSQYHPFNTVFDLHVCKYVIYGCNEPSSIYISHQGFAVADDGVARVGLCGH